jgi:hypothetical protein
MKGLCGNWPKKIMAAKINQAKKPFMSRFLISLQKKSPM